MHNQSEAATILTNLHNDLLKIYGKGVFLIDKIDVLESEVLETFENGDTEREVLLNIHIITDKLKSGSHLIKVTIRLLNNWDIDYLFKMYKQLNEKINRTRNLIVTFYNGILKIKQNHPNDAGEEEKIFITFSPTQFYRIITTLKNRELPVINDQMLTTGFTYFKGKLGLDEAINNLSKMHLKKVVLGKNRRIVASIKEENKLYHFGLMNILFIYEIDNGTNVVEKQKYIITPFVTEKPFAEFEKMKVKWENLLKRSIGLI